MSTEERLKAWLDGELDAAAARELAERVELDPELASRADAYRAISARLQSAASPAPERTVESICLAAHHARRDEIGLVRTLQRLTAAAAILIVSTIGLHLSMASGDAMSSGSGSGSGLDGGLGLEGDGMGEFLYEDEGVSSLLARDL